VIREYVLASRVLAVELLIIQRFDWGICVKFADNPASASFTNGLQRDYSHESFISRKDSLLLLAYYRE